MRDIYLIPLPSLPLPFLLLCFYLKSVIDGDLCEYFNSLDSSKRRNIAEELDRTPAEVSLIRFKAN